MPSASASVTAAAATYSRVRNFGSTIDFKRAPGVVVEVVRELAECVRERGGAGLHHVFDGRPVDALERRDQVRWPVDRGLDDVGRRGEGVLVQDLDPGGVGVDADEADRDAARLHDVGGAERN